MHRVVCRELLQREIHLIFANSCLAGTPCEAEKQHT